MQISDDNSASPDFQKAARLDREQAIDLRMALITSPRVQREYAELKARQQKELLQKQEQQEAVRDETVEALKPGILMERLYKVHPVLRPPMLTGQDRQAESQAAGREALDQVLTAEKQRLAEMHEPMLTEREQFCEAAERRQSLMDRFNQSAGKPDRGQNGPSKGHKR